MHQPAHVSPDDRQQRVIGRTEVARNETLAQRAVLDLRLRHQVCHSLYYKLQNTKSARSLTLSSVPGGGRRSNSVARVVMNGVAKSTT